MSNFIAVCDKCGKKHLPDSLITPCIPPHSADDFFETFGGIPDRKD